MLNQSRHKSILISIGGVEDKASFLPSARRLQKMGFKLYATPGTSDFLRESGVKNTLLYKIQTKKKPNLLDVLSSRKIDLVINFESAVLFPFRELYFDWYK